MDVTRMLAELRQERQQIEEAIITLERLARGRGKRRGRPPLWLQEAKKRASAAQGGTAGPGRPRKSAEQSPKAAGA
jgi:hypothetical protein